MLSRQLLLNSWLVGADKPLNRLGWKSFLTIFIFNDFTRKAQINIQSDYFIE